MPADSIAADVEDVRDRALRYSLENGVAFLHKTLSPADQAAVRRLFASGAVQVSRSLSDGPRRCASIGLVLLSANVTPALMMKVHGATDIADLELQDETPARCLLSTSCGSFLRVMTQSAELPDGPHVLPPCL